MKAAVLRRLGRRLAGGEANGLAHSRRSSHSTEVTHPATAPAPGPEVDQHSETATIRLPAHSAGFTENDVALVAGSTRWSTTSLDDQSGLTPLRQCLGDKCSGRREL